MLSKRTLYSFISFRFVKLGLPRGHKSKKENVFQKNRRTQVLVCFFPSSCFRFDQMGDPSFQGPIVILETCLVQHQFELYEDFISLQHFSNTQSSYLPFFLDNEDEEIILNIISLP